MLPRRRPSRLIVRLALLGSLALLVTAAAPARAADVTLDKPVKFTAVKTDKTKLAGRVVAYGDVGFEYVKGKDERVTVKWDELDAANVFAVRSALLATGTADEWLELGRVLRALDGGEAFAEKAFARALRLDPKLKDRVAAAKAEAPEPPAAPGDAPGGTMPAEPKEAGGAAADDAGGPDAAKTGTAAGPQVVGASNEKVWKTLTEEEQAAAVKELEAFVAETQTKMQVELVRFETKYFLFYSDLSAKEAKDWAGLLDRMYARLAKLFGTGADVNVWRGKALVFVFSKAEDYGRFQRTMHQTDPGGSAGMCHAYGDGSVHIAFFRQPDPLKFAHVLVHESVHGFLHRFRGPAHIPSWANEGLAEVISSELVKRPARANETMNGAKRGLRLYKGLGGIFEADQIVAWQYPVAETLCAFMIKANKRGYVNFIVGIKEGLSWEESLEQRFKAPRAKLVKAYGASMGMKDLSE